MPRTGFAKWQNRDSRVPFIKNELNNYSVVLHWKIAIYSHKIGIFSAGRVQGVLAAIRAAGFQTAMDNTQSNIIVNFFFCVQQKNVTERRRSGLGTN